MTAGYWVYLYNSHQYYFECLKGNAHPKILHNPTATGAKISKGSIAQALNKSWSFEFYIALNHECYNSINPMISLVRVINANDDEEEFFGRVLKETGTMEQDGVIIKSFICEDFLGYFHDSAQLYSRVNGDVDWYLQSVINTHNSQVEEHKRFGLGKITVTENSDTVWRYTDYEETFDCLSNFFLKRFGGYFQVKVEGSLLKIDYLKSIGKEVNFPIEIGNNLSRANREANLEGLITRLIPVGADIEKDGDNEDKGEYVTHERYTIEDVNEGRNYVDDNQLIKQFGIIAKPVDWTEIKNKIILKQRALQYLAEQRVALSSWEVSVIDLSLLDQQYPKFKLGNTHPIVNPPLSGVEKLQITEKKIEVTEPYKIGLVVGDKSQTLSGYNLQQKEARESMQKVLQNQAAATRDMQKKLDDAQKALEETQKDFEAKLSAIDKNTSISGLKTTKTQYQNLMATEKATLEALKKQLNAIANTSDNAAIRSVLQTQIATSESKINNYETLITEIDLKIKELGG